MPMRGQTMDRVNAYAADLMRSSSAGDLNSAARTEREQAAAPLRQQLLRVPVGRRYGRRAGAHGVRQSAARDLRLVLIGADEDVGGLQIAAQLLGGDELIAKHHMFTNPELLRFPLESGPIRLAMPADDHGVGCSHHEVHEVRECRGERGQRAEHGLHALVRTEQAEGQQHSPPRDPKGRLQDLGVA